MMGDINLQHSVVYISKVLKIVNYFIRPKSVNIIGVTKRDLLIYILSALKESSAIRK